MRRTKEGVMRFHLPNMSCGGCARSVTRAIQSVDADARIVIDQSRREVELTSDLPRDRFASALAAAGFPDAPAAD
ncbi:heavy-metal-associated domain-containing protein [Paracoccus yeei]